VHVFTDLHNIFVTILSQCIVLIISQ